MHPFVEKRHHNVLISWIRKDEPDQAAFRAALP